VGTPDLELVGLAVRVYIAVHYDTYSIKVHTPSYRMWIEGILASYQDSLNGLWSQRFFFTFRDVPNIKLVCPCRTGLIDQGEISLEDQIVHIQY
jgi:hypothetical protein